MSDNDIQGRICSKCKRYKSLNDFYDYRRYCKKCGKKYKNTDASKARRVAYSKEYESRPEIKKRREEYLNRPDVKEHIRKRRKAYNDRPENKKRRKEYYQREDIKERERKRWRVHENNRNARKLDLPSTLTPAQWQHALDYFKGCCAACGRQMNDMFGEFTASIDHWIPLSYKGDDNPGTVATNILPLCHGVNGCNNSKGCKLPDEWISQNFGKHKAKKIATKVQVYFDSLVVEEVEHDR